MEDKSTDKQLNNTRKMHPNSLANLKKAKPWKLGESGNPEGRPKNIKYISEALRELAESDPEFIKELVVAIRARAKKGDVPAFKEIGDRMDGKVAEKLDVGDVPVTIILKRAEDRDATE